MDSNKFSPEIRLAVSRALLAVPSLDEKQRQAVYAQIETEITGRPAGCVVDTNQLSLFPNPGMVQTEAATKRMDPAWFEKALALLELYPPLEFLVEDLAEWCLGRGLAEPSNPRAWGPLICKAKAAGLVEAVGMRYTQKTGAGTNSSPATLWRKVA